MFERFTDRARRAVVLASEEARLLNHNYIGTEHILLGLLRETDGVAARALSSLGVSLAGIRHEVEEIIGYGKGPPTGHIPFTPRTKKVLGFSLREAMQLGHSYIGTEHILLGLIREGEGVGAQALRRRGAGLNAVRATVIALLGEDATEAFEMLLCSFCASPHGQVDRLFAGRTAHICDACVGRAEEHFKTASQREGGWFGYPCDFCGQLPSQDVLIYRVERHGYVADSDAGSELRPCICSGCVQDCRAILEGRQPETETIRPVGPPVRSEPRKGRAPACPGCRAPLVDTARTLVRDIPDADGGVGARVLFLFCAVCGLTIDDVILP